MLDLAAKIVPADDAGAGPRRGRAPCATSSRPLFARVSPALDLEDAAVGAPGARAGDHDPARTRSGSTASARCSRPGTSSSRARRAPRSARTATPVRHGTFATAAERLPGRRGDGLRRALPAADPPDRQDQPQGPQQHAGRRGRTTSARRGRSARTRAATTRSTRELGTLEDFREFVAAAARARAWRSRWTWRCSARPTTRGSPTHPEWFTTRADGTIAYAENPPKKYQDIYPLNFDNDPKGLRDEVLRVVLHWVEQGVKIFRVDNPHTKPLNFWQWLIWQGQGGRPGRAVPGRGVHPAGDDARARQDRLHPVVHVLHLAHHGLGDARSTARSWSAVDRLDAAELLAEHARTSCTRRCSTAARRCSRSGRCWPACSRRPGACTAGYELFEHVAAAGRRGVPRQREVPAASPRDWAGGRAAGRSLAPYLTRLNQIRRENPALHWLRNLRFHEIDNGALLCLSKRDPETGNTVLVICSFDSAQRAVGQHHPGHAGARLRLARAVHGHRPAHRRDVRLGAAQRGPARPVRRAGTRVHGAPRS